MRKYLYLTAILIPSILVSPRVGFATDVISATCTDKNGRSDVFNFDISGGRQDIHEIGEVNVGFKESKIILSNDKYNVEFDIKTKHVYSDGENVGVTCEFQNLNLIKKAISIQKNQKTSQKIIENFVYGNDVKAINSLTDSVKNLCKGDMKCTFNKVWAYLDISNDNRLSLSEIARFQRNVLKFAAVTQKETKLKTEDIVAINLASIMLTPLTASSILHSFDYDNDGLISKREVLGDTEFSKLVGVHVDSVSAGLDFQSLGERLQGLVHQAPFFK